MVAVGNAKSDSAAVKVANVVREHSLITLKLFHPCNKGIFISPVLPVMLRFFLSKWFTLNRSLRGVNTSMGSSRVPHGRDLKWMTITSLLFAF